MIHDDPDGLTPLTPKGPKILPWPEAYFERIREMTDRELKLRAVHLNEEKKRRIQVLSEMPKTKKRKKKRTNAQDP